MNQFCVTSHFLVDWSLEQIVRRNQDWWHHVPGTVLDPLRGQRSSQAWCSTLPWRCFRPLGGLQIISCQPHYVLSLSCSVMSDSMDCSTPGFPVLHYLLEFAKTHVHWVDDTIQPSHPLSPPSPPALNLSQHQGLFQWVGSSYQMAKLLEFQLQYQSFHWIFRVNFL